MRDGSAMHGRYWPRRLICVVVLATLAACTSPGQDGAKPETPSGAVGVSEAGSEAGSEQPTVADSEAAPVDDFAALFSGDPDVLPAEPAPAAATAAELIGGPPDRVSVTIIRRKLRKAGHDLTGAKLHVFPIEGERGSLLVMSADDSSSMVEDSGDMNELSEDFGPDLLAALRSKGVGVTQVAFNFSSTDAEGPYAVTLTFTTKELKRLGNARDDDDPPLRVQITRGGK